ncbi:MAG: DUF4835 family protein [Hymenobacter sp.]
MRKILALLALLVSAVAYPGRAQELNAQVAISLENVTITDPTLVAQLQKVMTDFLNTRTWTKQPYRPRGAHQAAHVCGHYGHSTKWHLPNHNAPHCDAPRVRHRLRNQFIKH